ncbi:MAG: non-homologous end-joining DNA ligase, partial [Halobacteriales archaeon]|nr:non-homologous end-joining DNA ligase [Halobacteriales archaeon]
MARARLAPGALRPVVPMMAQPGELPRGRAAREYGYEFKWDGIRALAYWDARGLRLFSRNSKDVTLAFPELLPFTSQLRGHAAVLDGEIVALDAKGRPDFGLLQQRLGRVGELNVQAGVRAVPAAYILFDLLHLDGRDLLAEPYTERRRRLRALKLEGPAWSTPRHHSDGPAMLRTSKCMGLEGVVAKRLDSPYVPGARTEAWVKVRNRLRQEFVIGGWSEGQGNRAGTIGSLLMGHYGSLEDPQRLVYVGKVGAGLGGATLPKLLRMLRSLAGPSPFDSSIAAQDGGNGDAHFVRPELVAEVEFSG